MSSSSPSTLTISPGRLLLTLVSLSTSISCYIADWNETHVKNPKWPPHARFHNGQTMSMGLVLGLLTLYFTWRKPPKPQATSSPSGPGSNIDANKDGFSVALAKDSITSAALVGSLYWITGISAIMYPGTKWVDPEFGTGAPQRGVFLGHLVLVWVGWWLEMRKLSRLEKEEVEGEGRGGGGGRIVAGAAPDKKGR
ncbi:hypothetical protein HRR83_004794 [Exophiala dermatitidis]|uniref:Uncharacterized protein n=2 Tax=Exophiala dermatitidis TaxID=5970 RepID=H6BS86_EXODN|nr:uncharacterized protein HMPREF1120_02316 [Exophiala dermatitidis NIH/UT8656]KAJ4515524.1 hypothetical protein HRR75_003603 [Exophiala dermatitidis]EHY54141.1 hypothetical protein HMPREF1120_02316 [Exophiala dermatitidis NIH/UT8656]KAJ4519186.1 hypothetical protein HRR74_003927 [Exophiala dermatitidis]KAJ4529002.1 hypothetical protein HRR73_000022 [Exophiala dermatitidis]KAJ4538398.1 hypothetical protein HRR77_006883 [Exophiala dermatitidis]